MRLNAWPPAESFDPRASDLTPLPWFEEVAGRAILVVASARARREDWSAATVTALAENLAAAGARVLVADLTFDHTNLADRLAVPNDEGLSDVFLYGASLGHVIHGVPGHGFDLVPPGAFVPDPADLMRDRGWDALLEEILLQGRTLLVYAGAEVAGITALSTRIRDVVVLTSSGEAEAIAGLLSDACRVHSVLMPPAPAPSVPSPRPAPARDPESPEPELRRADDETDRAPAKSFEQLRIPRDAEREALIAELRARQRAALMAPPSEPSPDPAPAPETPLSPSPSPDLGPAEVRPPSQSLSPSPSPSPSPDFGLIPPELLLTRRPGRRGVALEPPITEPTFVDALSLQPPRKGRRALVFGLSFLTVAVVVVAAWIMARRHLDAAEVPPAEAPAVLTPVGSAKPLPYAVAVEAHQHLPLALERVESLRRAEPEIGFYIAPFLIGNELWYRILAGPVADSGAGSALLTYLLDKQHKTGATPNDLRRDPLAFLIGDFRSEGDANKRRQEIEALGIPGYIVPSVAPDGGALYRVYAGAYSGTAEANIMRQLLRSAGLPDSLVERTGR